MSPRSRSELATSSNLLPSSRAFRSAASSSRSARMTRADATARPAAMRFPEREIEGEGPERKVRMLLAFVRGADADGGEFFPGGQPGLGARGA